MAKVLGASQGRSGSVVEKPAPMPGDTVPGWTTPEEARNVRARYEAELLRRFRAGEPLTKSDRRDARRLSKAQGAS